MTRNDPMEQLRERVSRWAGQADAASILPALTLYKGEQPCHVSEFARPNLGLLLQGHKELLHGDRGHTLQSSQFIITALDMPLTARISGVSPEQPYLALSLRLDLKGLAELALRLPAPPYWASAHSGFVMAPLSPELLLAVERYVSLLDEPQAVPLLALPREQEVYYRLLTSEAGPKLRQMLATGAPQERIAQTVDYLTRHYREPFELEKLLSDLSLSPATFYRHFRELTGMTPLQLHKWLRLQEARRLIMTERMGAAQAAFEVGYESASQFSREYRRLFGQSPAQDKAGRNPETHNELEIPPK